MVNRTQIAKEDFESLLNWLSADSDLAGIEYEKIRQGLVRFFRYKGCSESKVLADETINRVAKKLDSLDLTKGYKKVTIIRGFAVNVFREYLRDLEKNNVQLDKEVSFEVRPETETEEQAENDIELDCLEKCLKKVSNEDRILVTKYFSKEKSEKITLRKKIAEELGITPNALHVRVYRIRQKLKKCINNCVEKKNV